jgi:tetratricopeptide (TPR) repeat protein
MADELIPEALGDAPEEPKSLDELSRKGWAAHAQGEHSAAERYFREAIAKHPRAVDAYYGMGLTLKAEGKRDDAINTFNKVLELLNEGAEESKSRAEMMRRLTKGHINQMQKGDWDLESEIWKKKE